MSTQSNKLDQNTVECIAIELIEGKQINSDIARSWDISEPTLYRIRKGDHTLLTEEMRVKLWKKFNPERLPVRVQKKVEPIAEKQPPKLQRNALPSLSKLMNDATAPTLTRPAVRPEPPKVAEVKPVAETPKVVEAPKPVEPAPKVVVPPSPAQQNPPEQPKQEQKLTMHPTTFDSHQPQPQQPQPNQVRDLENFKRTLKALQQEMEHHGISSIAIDKDAIHVSKKEIW